MNRVLITGVTGFKGSHLAEYCLAQGDEVHGLRRPRSREEHLIDGVDYHDGDVRDSGAMMSIVGNLKPRYLWHLAAQSFVPQSNIAPHDTIDTNEHGTVNVLDAVRFVSQDTRVVLACTSEEYGDVSPENIPITEDCPLKPLSMYGNSKVHVDNTGRIYHVLHGLDIVRARSFNNTGPRRGEQFVCSRFAKAIAEIEVNKRYPVITHGNLEALRDFSDVRDTVQGYYRMALHGDSGDVYNLCSGKTIRIGDILDQLIKMSSAQVEHVVDEGLVRPNEVPVLHGNGKKAWCELEYKTTIPFQQTLEDLLEYWRERV